MMNTTNVTATRNPYLNPPLAPCNRCEALCDIDALNSCNSSMCEGLAILTLVLASLTTLVFLGCNILTWIRFPKLKDRLFWKVAYGLALFGLIMLLIRQAWWVMIPGLPYTSPAAAWPDQLFYWLGSAVCLLTFFLIPVYWASMQTQAMKGSKGVNFFTSTPLTVFFVVLVGSTIVIYGVGALLMAGTFDATLTYFYQTFAAATIPLAGLPILFVSIFYVMQGRRLTANLSVMGSDKNSKTVKKILKITNMFGGGGLMLSLAHWALVIPYIVLYQNFYACWVALLLTRLGVYGFLLQFVLIFQIPKAKKATDSSHSGSRSAGTTEHQQSQTSQTSDALNTDRTVIDSSIDGNESIVTEL